MKWLKRILIGLIAIITIVVIGFWAWATIGAQKPEATAQAELQRLPIYASMMFQSDRDGYSILPAKTAKSGFIFYSGGLVEPEAYAAHLQPIAEAGYAVFAPKMTLNLAVFNINAADDIIAAHPEIENWIIGGHSLGGAMAAQYTADNDDKIDGLVLWASFPAESTDLSGHDILAASIYGSNDGLASPEEIKRSAERLPNATIFVEIIGGNHAQFGDYGEQSGDQAANISLEEQITQVVKATVGLINSFD